MAGAGLGRLEGKVALITGGARGQGRAHAVKLAEEGADIVVTDICEQLESVDYEMATQVDLDETVRLVEELDRRCLGYKADARDATRMKEVVDFAVGELGHIDVLSVNHGVVSVRDWSEWDDQSWSETMDSDLTGVWNCVRPVVPHMIEGGDGGSIVLTSSASGAQAQVGLLPYMAAKHGVVGLGRSLAAELAKHWIRVNVLLPGNIASPMLHNQYIYDLFAGKEGAGKEDMMFATESMLLLPTPWLNPREVSNALAFLACDESKFITGITLPVDGGMLDQPPGIPPIASQRLAHLEKNQAGETVV